MDVTIRDVAKAAGVSVGTVSNVLNRRASVSDANRTLVLNAMENLGYNPNLAARALKTGRSGNIGLVIPDIGNPFYPEFARGAEDIARAAGYGLFLCNSDRDEKKEKEYILSLLDRAVDGLILYKPHLPQDQLCQFFHNIPSVLVDASPQLYPLHHIVNSQDHAGILMALDYLWDLGHREIAFIAGRPDSYSARSRIRAYEDFLSCRQNGVPPGYLQHGLYDWHSGYECATALLRRTRAPTAILAANDLMAIGAIKAAQQRGIRIPEDVSIVGNDDITMAALSTPALTTIVLPKYEMGERSVQLLLMQMQGQVSPKEHLAADPEMAYRQSAKKYSL